jgi:hypothetical protein
MVRIRARRAVGRTAHALTRERESPHGPDVSTITAMPGRKYSERHSDPMEHRWGERVALLIPVKLTAGGATGDGVLRDLSVSGAFIDTTTQLPVFTNLVVSVQMNDEPLGASPDLAACVVRCEPAGVAVEWRDMACETLVALLGRAGAESALRLGRDRAWGHPSFPL